MQGITTDQVESKGDEVEAQRDAQIRKAVEVIGSGKK